MRFGTRLVLLGAVLLLTLFLSACGGKKQRNAPLVVPGTVGESTSAMCGERANLQFADVTANGSARVLAARLVHATPGLRAVDVVGAPELQSLAMPRTAKGVPATGLYGSHVSITGVGDVEALAVHPPDGVPISENLHRPTALFVTVVGSCRSLRPAGRQVDFSAHGVQLTVRRDGHFVKQTIATDLEFCVGRVDPAECP